MGKFSKIGRNKLLNFVNVICYNYDTEKGG